MEARVSNQTAQRVRGDKATRGQGQILQGVAGHCKDLASLGTKCWPLGPFCFHSCSVLEGRMSLLFALCRLAMPGRPWAPELLGGGGEMSLSDATCPQKLKDTRAVLFSRATLQSRPPA